ncbi:hypothetical protein IMCC20628_02171 [Hoeflea sp. IMCC20628]|uniref:hypothetical protein n=1 Tax=Hoeflea sp. IMCC20628 TaxID=1620421 RepID=UPI00063AAF7C|nr:hypothetical protein [Hoeflea sp. IMCC20628]AKI00875.1 hypothetical protein IMCC20628_02171 [Hoeflea sp. IMCC20628]
MRHALRLAKMQQIHSDKEPEIIRLVTDPATSTYQKQMIYGCLNKMCRMSASLFGDLSSKPGNYDLIEQAAELDKALLDLRSFVGSHISIRLLKAA